LRSTDIKDEDPTVEAASGPPTASIDNLTINTPKAHFTENIPVSGDVTVEAVDGNTLELLQKIGKLIFKTSQDASVEIADAAGKPSVTIAAPKTVSGIPNIKLKKAEGATNDVITGPISVNANATIVVNAPVGTVTGNAETVNVTANDNVTVAGKINDVTVPASDTKTDNTTVTVEPNTVVAKVDAGNKTKVEGTGTVKSVVAKADTTVAANTEEVDVRTTAGVKLAASVETITVNVNASISTDVTGNKIKVGKIVANNSVSIGKDVVVTERVTVPEENVKVVIEKGNSIPVLETKKDVTITGAVTTVAVTGGNGARITGEGTASVGKITTTGKDIDSIEPAGTLAANTPKETIFAEPELDKTTLTHPYKNGAEALVPGSATFDISSDATLQAAAVDTETAPTVNGKTITVSEAGTYEVWATATNPSAANAPKDSLHVKVTFKQGVDSVTIAPASGTIVVGKDVTATISPANAETTLYAWTDSTKTYSTSSVTAAESDWINNKNVKVTVKGFQNGNTVEDTLKCDVIADVSGLKSVITAAEALLSDASIVVIGDNQSADDVTNGLKFVTQKTRGNLNDAIDTAKDVAANKKNTNTQKYPTTTEVEAQVTAVENAMKTFKAEIKDGTAHDVSAKLGDYIEKAKGVRDKVKPSADGNNKLPTDYWVSTSLDSALAEAISKAETANSGSDDSAKATALQNLMKALSDVESNKKLGTDTTGIIAELEAAIANANAKKENVKEGSDGSTLKDDQLWASAESIKALENAIDEAGEADTSTYENTKKALDNLNNAINAFKPAPGTMIDTLLSIVRAPVATADEATEDKYTISVNTNKPLSKLEATPSTEATGVTAPEKVTVTAYTSDTGTLATTPDETDKFYHNTVIITGLTSSADWKIAISVTGEEGETAQTSVSIAKAQGEVTGIELTLNKHDSTAGTLALNVKLTGTIPDGYSLQAYSNGETKPATDVTTVPQTEWGQHPSSTYENGVITIQNVPTNKFNWAVNWYIVAVVGKNGEIGQPIQKYAVYRHLDHVTYDGTVDITVTQEDASISAVDNQYPVDITKDVKLEPNLSAPADATQVRYYLSKADELPASSDLTSSENVADYSSPGTNTINANTITETGKYYQFYVWYLTSEGDFAIAKSEVIKLVKNSGDITGDYSVEVKVTQDSTEVTADSDGAYPVDVAKAATLTALLTPAGATDVKYAWAESVTAPTTENPDLTAPETNAYATSGEKELDAATLSSLPEAGKYYQCYVQYKASSEATEFTTDKSEVIKLVKSSGDITGDYSVEVKVTQDSTEVTADSDGAYTVDVAKVATLTASLTPEGATDVKYAWAESDTAPTTENPDLTAPAGTDAYNANNNTKTVEANSITNAKYYQCYVQYKASSEATEVTTDKSAVIKLVKATESNNYSVVIGVAQDNTDLTAGDDGSYTVNVNNTDVAKPVVLTAIVKNGETPETDATVKWYKNADYTASSANVSKEGTTTSDGWTEVSNTLSKAIDIPVNNDSDYWYKCVYTVESTETPSEPVHVIVNDDSMKDVIAANLVDRSETPQTTLYDGDSYKVAVTSVKNGVVNVKFSATNLVSHQNGDTPSTNGYWVGIGIPYSNGDLHYGSWSSAPNDTSEFTTNVADSEMEKDDKIYKTFYFGLTNDKKVNPGYIAVQRNGVITTYVLDFSGVTLKPEP